MYSSRLSQKLDETQRFDLTGQAEVDFLLARAGKHSGDKEFQEKLPRILAARKVGRRRWQNRISTAKHYAQNKESKKQYSRLQEEQEVKKQEIRDVQARWRSQNAGRLAQKQRERRAHKNALILFSATYCPSLFPSTIVTSHIVDENRWFWRAEWGGVVERSILGPMLIENDNQPMLIRFNISLVSHIKYLRPITIMSMDDYSKIFEPLQKNWDIDTVLDAVQSVNFISEVNYTWEKHACAPVLHITNRQPDKRFYVVMDSLVPPRFTEGIYRCFEDVQAAFPANDPEPSHIVMEQLETLDEAINFFRSKCLEVHSTAIGIAQQEKEFNECEAYEEAEEHLSQLKARIVAYEMKKLYPNVFSGEIGIPELWFRHRTQSDHETMSAAVLRNPRVVHEKCHMMIGATSLHNNNVSLNFQRANPNQTWGSVENNDNGNAVSPPWAEWNFFVVTPNEEVSFKRLKKAYWDMWEKRRLLQDADMFLAKSANVARRAYIRLHTSNRNVPWNERLIGDIGRCRDLSAAVRATVSKSDKGKFRPLLAPLFWHTSLLEISFDMGRTKSAKVKTTQKSRKVKSGKASSKETSKETRGCKSYFKGARLAFMETSLDTFLSLPKRGQACKAFWPKFMAELLEKFPLSDYPLPPDTLEPLPPLTKEERNAMTSKQKKNRLKAEQRRKDRTDENRLLVIAQNWFRYQESVVDKDSNNLFESFLRDLNEVPDRPRRPQLRHHVATHPKYKKQVEERSKETCRTDRLPSRMQAAKDIIEDMPETEVTELEKEIDDAHGLLLEEYHEIMEARKAGGSCTLDDQAICRANLTRVIHPFLHLIRKYTGLNVMFTAGRFKGLDGNQEKYDFLTLFSVPEGAPEWDQYRVDEYKDYGRKWCAWTRAVHQFETNQANDKLAGTSATDVTDLANVDSTTISKDGSDAMSSSTKTLRKARPAKARSDKDSEGETSDSEEETSDSEEETSDSEDSEEEGDEENPNEAGGSVAKSRPGGAIVCLPRHSPTCDYEEERASNITRNRAILEDLLAQIPPEESPFQLSKPKLKKKSKAQEKSNGRRIPATRKSARLNKTTSNNEESPAPQLDEAGPFVTENADDDNSGIRPSTSTTPDNSSDGSVDAHKPDLPSAVPSQKSPAQSQPSESLEPSPEVSPTPMPSQPPPASSPPSAPPSPSSPSPSPSSPSLESPSAPLEIQDELHEDTVDAEFRSAWSDVNTGGIGDANYPIEACSVEWIQQYARFLLELPEGCEERPKAFVDCVYLWITVEEQPTAFRAPR
ncbi:hypothetical protein VNI00_014902 [Paramarasmius palmivorus]|uniref:Uncharacterized protein n=1 Tax=Paramarasmius palmivorus TaxID=297713 RepID=A0AAW0BNG0_9AGAR